MFKMLANIFRNLSHPPATRLYPASRRPPIPGSRGHLTIDAAACVYCGLCAKHCPANALVVTRKPSSWTLEPYRCIYCGDCVERCPKKCLSMDPRHDSRGS